MEFKVGTTNVEASNDFLKKLWSILSDEFGAIGWNFTPYKKGEKKRVYFGQLSLGNMEPGTAPSLSVSVEYNRKGTIEKLFMQPIEGSLVNVDEETNGRIVKCVEKAMGEIPKRLFSVSGYLRSYDKFINYNQSKNFELTPLESTGKTLINFKILSYDEKQVQIEVLEKMDILVSLLALDTNNIFTYRIKSQVLNDYPVEKIDKSDIFCDWNFEQIWKKPLVKEDDSDYLLLSLQMFKIIDKLLEPNFTNLDFLKNVLLAMDHFHNGVKMYENFLDQKSIRQLGPILHGDFEELALTLFLSALEVITLTDSVERCDKCSQPIYSIKKRVVDKVGSVFPDDIRAQLIIKEYYDARSSFLHSGKSVVDTIMLGFTIPQLSLSDKTGCKRNFSNIDLELLKNMTRAVILKEIEKMISNGETM